MKKYHNIDYSQKVLEVKNLQQYFKVGMGKRKIVVKAVDDISFDVYKREVFGLVGESGCGKTTTGRTIIKLYNPTNGEIIYNGKIIGAGYEGFKENIRKIRRTAKNDILFYKPYDKKRYELKNQYFYDRLEIKNKIKQLETELEQQKAKILAPINDYKEVLKQLKHNYLINKTDFEFQYQLEKNNILTAGIIPIILDSKYSLKASKQRLKDKISFTASLKLEKYEFNEQVAILKKDYENDLERIDNELRTKFKKLNINLEEDNINLIKKEEKADKKKCLKESKDKLIAATAEIKEKYNADREKCLVESFNREEINNDLAIVKENHTIKLNNYQEELKKLKDKLKEDLAVLKEDYKENPEKYIVNLEEIEKIKEERNEKIKEQRVKIHLAQTRNKLKELPEERNTRITKLRDLKKEYYKNKQALTKQFLTSDKENANQVQSNKIAYQQELKELEKEYKKAHREIQLSKPSFTNRVSTMQMIFQDPISSLNPRMVVSEIISEGLVIRGEKDKNLIREKVYKVLNYVGLDKGHATRYPHEFSGGQRQRIGIARAIVVDPDFIIADEPISALDVSIQAQIINLLNDLKEKLGLTILFIAHDLSVVKYFSDRIAVMYMGKIVELASSKELFANPLHPYTKSLLSAIPYPDPISEKTRQRMLYNPMMHDYRNDKPVLHEIKKDHFIYANDKEYKTYQKELKGGE